MEFKVGDRVRLVSDRGELSCYRESVGKTGKIVGFGQNAFGKKYARIQWDDRSEEVVIPYLHNLEKVEETPLQTVSCRTHEDIDRAMHTVIFDKFISPSNTNQSRSLMSRLQAIPNRIKRLLNANQKAFYQLEWVDEDLDPSEAGIEALNSLLWDEYEAKLGKIAQTKVRKIKKQEKKG